ncbi:hypothetical protein CHS0354_035361 [Potamilus streckersoni]|uniref:Thioredoxin domain-containing protein n=1 Tax=Potamilus streckersoni TaxID=2493646 RepID=A0AAE0VPI4_9BIVA|nr:hypothetical protein CHS0354_035361 [Potamilus streckersoni]
MNLKTKKVWLSVCFSLLGLSVVGLFLYGLLSGNDPKAIPTSFIGKPAPNFELKDLNGKSIRLSDYAGKAVILNFWASWCVPCREEAPLLESFWQNYQTKNTVVLGIASNDKPESVQKFIHEFRLTFPTVLDTEKGCIPMLAGDLILSYSRGERIFPKYLQPEEVTLEPLRQALQLFDEQEPFSRRELEENLHSVIYPYFTPKVTQGLIAVITAGCEFENDLKQDVTNLRENCFTRSAAIWKNATSETIPEPRALTPFFAKQFGMPAEIDLNGIEELLYADVRKNRRLLKRTDYTAEEIINRYNISQVQGILISARTASVIVRKADNMTLRSLLFKLRFLGLIFHISDTRKNGSTTLQIEGPASMLENGRSYGIEFAHMFPALLNIHNTGWELKADIFSKRKAGAVKKLSVTSDSGYPALKHEQGVWFRNEISDFIDRWNVEVRDFMSVAPAEEFFTDYKQICRIPDIVFSDPQHKNSKIYLEWLRYPPTDPLPILTAIT